jgi:protein-S-isoprenylcysteine O-methyltransferase Ste14
MGVVFVLMWEIHYVQRTFVFPFLLRGGQERMPLGIPLMGIAFNLVNGCLQGGYLFRLAPEYGAGWLSDPRFISGALLFFAGLAINWRSDAILRSLRKSGEKGYQIPTGGLYRLVSCPNYLGEMIEWAGWAIATWSVSGLAFAFWTVCNLFPRALAHHRWYIGAFPDYPRERKAVIPYII